MINGEVDLTTRKLLAACGIVGPVFFTIFVVVESVLRPGYSQIMSEVSGLGVGPNAILQSINFWVTGVLTILAATGLEFGFVGDAWPRKTGPALVGIGGVGMVLAGFFPDAPDPYPGDVHIAVAILFFFGITAAMFVLRLAQDADVRWKGWGRISLYFGISGLIFIVSLGSPVDDGFFERILIAIIFLWLGFTSWKLFTLEGRQSAQVVP